MKSGKWMFSILIFLMLVLPAIATTTLSASPEEDIKCRIIVHYIKGDQQETPDPIEKAATGAGWATFSIWLNPPMEYYVFPKNSEGFTSDYVVNTLGAAAETWDDETNVELFDDTPTVLAKASIGKYDGKNVIGFGNLRGSYIAVTYIWYTSVTILEWDMKFNSRLAWGDAEPTKYDFQAIACHEFGHTFGMEDIYDSSYSYVTMYGFGVPGDIEPRTLAAPDIAGLEYLYGS